MKLSRMKTATAVTTTTILASVGCVLAAAPAHASTAAGSIPNTRVVKAVSHPGGISADTVYNVGCWTTFVPGNPGGGPMTQYYANCASYPVTVCPAVRTASGLQVYRASAWYLGSYDGLADSSDTAVWSYAATIPGGQYTTVFC